MCIIINSDLFYSIWYFSNMRTSSHDFLDLKRLIPPEQWNAWAWERWGFNWVSKQWGRGFNADLLHQHLLPVRSDCVNKAKLQAIGQGAVLLNDPLLFFRKNRTLHPSSRFHLYHRIVIIQSLIVELSNSLSSRKSIKNTWCKQTKL